MTNQFSRTRDKVQSVLNLQPRRAVIGDWQGVVDDPYWPDSGNVQVRFLASDGGYGLPTLVRGPYMDSGIPLQPDHAVLIKLDTDGLPYVAATDWDTVQAGGGRPVPAQPSLDGGYVRQDQIVTLRCAQTAPPSLSIIISGWKAIVESVGYDFEGDPEFDMTSYLPGSDHAVVGVFMADDYITPAVYTGTPQPLNDDLTMDNINEVLAMAPSTYTAVWFYDVAFDATEILDSSTLFDGRQVINPAPGEYRATVSTTSATVTTILTFTIPDSTTYAIHANVAARRTGGSSGTAEDGAFYERVAAFKNVAGSAAQIGSTNSPVTIEDQAGWDVTFDVTGATARVRVTGAANNNVSWMMIAKVVKVSS